MKTYIFYRGSFFFFLDFNDKEKAIKYAKLNAKITKISTLTGKIIWKYEQTNKT